MQAVAPVLRLVGGEDIANKGIMIIPDGDTWDMKKRGSLGTGKAFLQR